MGTLVDPHRELKDLTLRELVSEVRFRTSDLLRHYNNGKPRLVEENTAVLLFLGEAEGALTKRVDDLMGGRIDLKSQEPERQ